MKNTCYNCSLWALDKNFYGDQIAVSAIGVCSANPEPTNEEFNAFPSGDKSSRQWPTVHGGDSCTKFVSGDINNV